MAPLSQHLPRRTEKSHECPIRITNPSAITRKMGAPKCERRDEIFSYKSFF
jgi:hypothetical protein